MRTLPVLSLMFAASAAPLVAQAVVDPGMSKAQVIAKLGRPSNERTADRSTFLFFGNGQERRVGMTDLVILTNDKVVDAIFRSSGRRFSGTSSSPAAIPPEVARQHATPLPQELKLDASPKKP